MGDFRNFLEGRYGRGGAGGAFGRDNRKDAWSLAPEPKKAVVGNRDDNRFKDIQQRVDFGKQMEAKIVEALRSSGWKVNPATKSQDMHDKVDCWVERGGKWLPMQIKYRDSGDEIAMECILGWHPSDFDKELNFNGRDMVGISKLYGCLNMAGTEIRVCSADEAKAVARASVEKLRADYKKFGSRVGSTSAGEARITGDPSNGRAKVMSFVKPQALASLERVKIKDTRGLWAA